MIRKKLFILSVILFFTLMSCYTGRPLKKGKAENNNTYTVEYLFEHEGCKVYRFYDEGTYIYFTNCTGNVTVASKDSSDSKIQTIINREK